MAEQVNHDYEVSSEGAVRHWAIPYSRLSDQTPTPSNPAMVTNRVAGQEMTGTILSVDAATSMAVIDFTHSMVYKFSVRNVLTYGAGPAEATWGAINIGDSVFYDDTVTMPAGVYLSTSPLDGSGNASPLFGHVVPLSDADAALYPKGGATASTQTCAVCQEGA